MMRKLWCVFAAVALGVTLLGGRTVAGQQPSEQNRWLLLSDGYRVIDWSAVQVIWFDAGKREAVLSGVIPGLGHVTDASWITRVRGAVLAEPNRWIKIQVREAEGGNPWDDPRTIEGYASYPHITRVVVVQAIDAPGQDKEVMNVFNAQGIQLGRVIAPDKARLLTPLNAPWPRLTR